MRFQWESSIVDISEDFPETEATVESFYKKTPHMVNNNNLPLLDSIQLSYKGNRVK